MVFSAVFRLFTPLGPYLFIFFGGGGVLDWELEEGGGGKTEAWA